LGLALMVLVSGHLRHHFCKCFMMSGFVLRNLMSNLLRAFVLLELVLLKLVGQFMGFEFMLFEFVREFRVFEFVLLKFVCRFRVFELVGKLMLFELLFAERLAGDPAKNGAERTANRRANHGRCYARYILENRRGAPHEAAYAPRNAPKKLVSFEFL